MAAQHIEGTLRALQSKLQANLATTIATVNADAPDDYALDTVASEDVTIGVRADIVRYPAVMLLPVNSQPEADLGTRVMWVHQVRVVGWIAEYSEEPLALKLLRFQRALRECLMAGRIPSVSASTTAGYALRHLRDEFGPVFSPDGENNFVQAASSVFEVRQQQDLS
jgi:hypothetical protein